MNRYRSIGEQIGTHEGFRSRPYLCTAGRLTIGYGRNLSDVGVTVSEAQILLRNDIENAEADCGQMFPGWKDISMHRRWALIDMRFNLGPNRFRGFRKMIAAVNKGEWHEAARQAKDSKWFKQVGSRGYFVYRQLIGDDSGLS